MRCVNALRMKSAIETRGGKLDTERILNSKTRRARAATVVFAITCEADDVKRIDQRRRALGLRRATYLVLLARNDWFQPRDFPAPPHHKINRVTATVTCRDDDIRRIDHRATFLGMTRSQYLVGLARSDFNCQLPLSVLPEPMEVPGLKYQNGTLQIDATRFLQFLQLTDTPEHRAMTERFAGEVMAAKRLGN